MPYIFFELFPRWIQTVYVTKYLVHDWPWRRLILNFTNIIILSNWMLTNRSRKGIKNGPYFWQNKNKAWRCSFWQCQKIKQRCSSSPITYYTPKYNNPAINLMKPIIESKVLTLKMSDIMEQYTRQVINWQLKLWTVTYGLLPSVWFNLYTTISKMLEYL